MKIISVVGARPNFMKIAPFIKAINKYNAKLTTHHSPLITHLLVHTGQHYDDQMSNAFFQQLGIPQADINLGIGSGTHAEQVGRTMIEFEKVIQSEKPDWVVVVGDVNATLACSVTAKKELIKCCHIEAGLRSGDMSMPEEINRLVTDRLSDLLLTPDRLSIENLLKEGVQESRIRFVGNIMIDTLEQQVEISRKLTLANVLKDNILDKGLSIPNVEEEKFGVLTLHRPSNVDNKGILTNLIDFVCTKCNHGLVVIWPIHPRTYKRLGEFNLLDSINATPNLVLTQPLGYLEMLRLNMGAKIMLTDSGGLQEECTVLGTPCLTMRWNTERPITLTEHGGASVLVGNNIERITKEFEIALAKKRTPHRPELWDGHAAERCLKAIVEYR
ncbi:MAG: UDP-N-acetylglucosamine 2-epimerase (non-hydrolyzing) [Bacteroidales bacterium]|nr:MAG: UDP-N-acetylglucosamine 2-epimerase (non-hydrolyzing) [Bacteroidales bacterium]